MKMLHIQCYAKFSSYIYIGILKSRQMFQHLEILCGVKCQAHGEKAIWNKASAE